MRLVVKSFAAMLVTSGYAAADLGRSEMAWAVRLDDGRFRLPGGGIVEEIP